MSLNQNWFKCTLKKIIFLLIFHSSPCCPWSTYNYMYIDFFFQSHSYSRLGNVSLAKDNMVWTTSLWGHQFKVEFDIKVTKPVLPETWYSVFHLTKGNCESTYCYPQILPKYERNNSIIVLHC